MRHLREEENRYANLPRNLFLSKFEQTDIYEDPEDIRNYLRKNVADFSTEQPFFAYQENRTQSDSKEKLNYRYSYGRSTELPYLPDGTFLDYEFLVPDKRRPTDGPNLSLMKEHAEIRAKHTAFGRESNISPVSEGPIHQADMTRRIRDYGHKQFKHYFKNFQESVSGWATVSAVPSTTNDNFFTAEADAIDSPGFDKFAMIRDPVGTASNLISYNHHLSVPDQRMTISGVNSVKKYAYNKKIENAIRNTTNDGRVNPEISLLKIRHAVKLLNDEKVREGNFKVVDFTREDSKENSNNRLKMLIANELKLIDAQGYSQDNNYNHFESNNKESLRKSMSRALLDSTQTNHEVLESMILTTRITNNTNPKDLRDALIETCKRDNLTIENSNKTLSKKRTNDLRNENVDERLIKEQKTIKNYSNIKTKQVSMLNKITGEPYADNSITNLNKARKQNSKPILRETKGDQSMRDNTENRLPVVYGKSSGIRENQVYESLSDGIENSPRKRR